MTNHTLYIKFIESLHKDGNFGKKHTSYEFNEDGKNYIVTANNNLPFMLELDDSDNNLIKIKIYNSTDLDNGDIKRAFVINGISKQFEDNFNLKLVQKKQEVTPQEHPTQLPKINEAINEMVVSIDTNINCNPNIIELSKNRKLILAGMSDMLDMVIDNTDMNGDDYQQRSMVVNGIVVSDCRYGKLRGIGDSYIFDTTSRFTDNPPHLMVYIEGDAGVYFERSMKEYIVYDNGDNCYVIRVQDNNIINESYDLF
jgi:hypothetical protein